MNTIRMKELLHEFKTVGICKDSTQKKPFANMLEWQDHIGRSNVREIVSFWEALPRRSDDGIDQDIFLWANQSTLNPDTVNSIYRDTVGKMIKDKVLADCDKAYGEQLAGIVEREKQVAGFIYKLNEWEGVKRKLQEEIQRLTDEHNAHMEATDDLVHRYENQIDDLIKERNSFRGDHIHWTALQHLLKELLTDEKEVKL